MTKYSNNEDYEKDKAKLFDAVAHNESFEPGNVGIYGLINNFQVAMNLLRQSMWAGDNNANEEAKINE